MATRKPTAEELFHACRAIPDEPGRRALLERATDDPAVRQRVLDLLAVDVTIDSDFLMPRAPAANKPSIGEQTGDVIDRYKLLQTIGEGGMGTVWMAEQREPVVRKVALKIIKLGMDTREVVVRFEAERQALALMDHPNIAKVLDGGSTPTGRPFFVMELVRGVPITEYCDQARLGLRARLELFSKVCEAIQHAHHKGVIHRDIKPSNVLVTLHDGTPVPKVIDFGIAKATSAELTKKTLFTQYAQIIGTPEYMAPEQAEMSGLDIDTRADVYSLGVLLYELLTGTKPFDVKTAMQAGFQELLRSIREDDPPKPSTRISTLGDEASPVAAHRELNVRTWSQRLRGDLDWIVMKALEKDRARRYETPNGFAEDIARFLRDEAVLAAPPSASYRFRKLVRRRRKTVVTGAFILLLLVLGIAGTSWGMLAAVAAKGEAQHNAELAGAEATKARAAEAEATQRAAEVEQVAAFQGAVLENIDVPVMGVELRRQLLAAVPAAARDEIAERLGGVNFTDLARSALDSNVFQRSITAIDAQFATQPKVQARLLAVVGHTMRELGLVNAARSPLEHAMALATQEYGPGDARTMSVRMSIGNLESDAGNLAAAESSYRTARDQYATLAGPNDRRTLEARQSLGDSLRSLGRYDEATAEQQAVIDLGTTAFGADDSIVLSAQHSMVALLDDRGRYVDEERLLHDLLPRERRQLGEDHDRTIATQHLLANLYSNTGRPTDAEATERQVYESYRRRLGDEHPRTLNAQQSLGVLLAAAGKFEEGDRTLAAVQATLTRTLGASHPDALICESCIGYVALQSGRLDEADRLLTHSVAGLRQRLGDNHDDTINALDTLSGLRREQGRIDEALRLFKVVLDGQRRLHGTHHRLTAGTLSNYAATLWSAGRAAEAVPLFRQALALKAEIFGAKSPDTLLTKANLAVNLRVTGNADEALQLLREVHKDAGDNPALAWAGVELLGLLGTRHARDEARSLATELIADSRQRLPPGSPELAGALAAIVAAMFEAEDWSTIEPLAREVLGIRQKEQPDAWTTANSTAVLGAVIAAQGRHKESEPLMVAGAERLLQLRGSIPGEAQKRVDEAVHRLVAMYEAWEQAEPGKGHAANAAEWRGK